MKFTTILSAILLLLYLSAQAQQTVYSTPKRDFVNVDSISYAPDKGAEFPGGEKALLEYLGSNLEYPEAAQKNKIEGQIFARIIVHSNGKVSNIELLRSLGYGCDEEVIRVLSAMPDWKPAELKGEKVPSYFMFPINFSLSEEQKQE